MNKRYRTATLATAIALAMASTAAFAAPPAADQLPGQGKVVSGAATPGDIANGAQTISVDGNTNGGVVINWGSGTDINKTGTAGFNIGSDASLTFAQGTGTDHTAATGVLNIDSSGNASQIMGSLEGGALNLYVANANGIIVGQNATINTSGAVGLIANETSINGGATAYTGDASTVQINGVNGGDVTVMKGASISGGTTVLISGGNNVNVALGALTGGAATLQAGRSNVGEGTFGGGGSDNTDAVLSVSGTLGGSSSIAKFDSAGDASNAGVLDVSGTDVATVDGSISNSGDLTLGSAFAGGVVNKGKLTGGASLGSLVNEGIYNPGGAVTITAGDLTNSGSIDAASGGITVDTGSLVNTGVIDNTGAVSVTDGVINNKGAMKGVASLTTQENSTKPTKGQYLGINNGQGASIAFTGTGVIDADSGATVTTGSFTNAGTLTLAASTNGLTVNAGTDIYMGGNVMVGTKAASATNAMGALALTASNGSVNLYSPMFVSGATLTGKYVNVNANLSAVDSSTGATAGTVAIVSSDDVGPAQLPEDGKFSVNIGSGATVSADTVTVDGTATAHPDVLLRGTLSGNTIKLGATNSVSNVWGAGGSLMATGTDANVGIRFTGAVKVAPPMNNKSNFRYNYLKIDAANPLTLTLNPVAYQTNGTSNGKSAVNILVGNDVTLLDTQTQTTPTGAVVAGINDTENTHLVLQSTGSITAGDSTNGFFWPGYVYLGTVASDSDGNAMPGTFSALNTITTMGNFDNTLAGRTENAGGIHFATSSKVNFGGNVYTNANSWVNFGNDAVTQFYAAGNGETTDGAAVMFKHGVISDTGNIVTYGEDLPTDYFHTQAANSKK